METKECLKEIAKEIQNARSVVDEAERRCQKLLWEMKGGNDVNVLTGQELIDRDAAIKAVAAVVCAKKCLC